jgi:Tsi6
MDAQMMHRTSLFEKTLSCAKLALERAPYMFPLESVISQLQYLLDLDSGKETDRKGLATLSIGQIAAHDIDSSDPSLAELLHDVAAQARTMLNE